jgi:hypothetical protein
LLAGGLSVAAALGAAPRVVLPPPRVVPKLEPVAETHLLMEGIAKPNFRGLEKLLREKPADAETWAFARGQSLLIAEAGNLLMIRPPKNPGEIDWMDRAADLRSTAVRVSRACADHDYEGGRAALKEMAGACNRCHQTFRVAARVVPFAEPPAP